MTTKRTIDQVDVAGKRTLMRVDFNVPLTSDGAIADDRRIRAALPSIRNVLERGGSLVLVSHLGRPKGEGYEANLSLHPCAQRLSELLGREVLFPSTSCVDEAARGAVASLAPGQAALLENLRFEKGERTSDPAFVQTLASYGDIYCNEAFGACHRRDASMVAVPRAMEGKPRVMGLLVRDEITAISKAVESPEKPFVAVLGGAKVSDKIGVVEHLIPKADAVCIGGAMAYTFLAALGKSVGESRVESDRIADAKRMLDLAAEEECDLMLPVDHVCSTEFAEKAGDVSVEEDEIPAGRMGLDIGPRTQTNFCAALGRARTIVWNGPMGVFEWAPFAVGTQQIAHAVADATARNGAHSVLGGGETALAAERFGVADKVSHVSTGGGASLALMAGERLEAVELLDDA